MRTNPIPPRSQMTPEQLERMRGYDAKRPRRQDYHAAYREAHKAERAAYHKAWRAAHREERRAHLAMELANRTYGERIEFNDWWPIWSGACFGCGVTPACGVDHIWPRARGGRNVVGNLQPACMACNRRKWSNVPGLPPLPTWAAGRKQK